MEQRVIGGIYTEQSEKFQKGIMGGLSRCLKAEKHDAGVVLMGVKVIGQMDGAFESINRVYDTNGLSPSLNTCGGGDGQPKIICAMRGRNPDNPSDRTAGSPTEQRLEPNSQGICNTLTSVQKDNMVMEQNPIIICDPHNLMPEMVETEVRYRIRKLTPRETWRLMDFSDEDFDKAQAVNSQTQLYKEAGNSIVVNVLVAIFGQMILGKENVYRQLGRFGNGGSQ